MAKRTSKTSEVELQDAINRIGKKPEAKQSSQTSRAWRNYLIDVLDINPQAVSSSKGKDFWENVRQGVRGEEPTIERKLAEANAEIYTNPKTSQVSYRSKETGRFIKL